MPARLGWGHHIAIGDVLAEQVARQLTFPRTGTVVDLIADGGSMTAAMSRVVRAPGRVIACELEGELVEVAEDVVEVLSMQPGTVPLTDHSADAVVSLLTIGFGDAAALLGEARRLARSAGAVALLVYDEVEPPVHETILRDALRAEGIESEFMQRMFPAGIVTAARSHHYAVTHISDVARYDGPGHYWRVMVQERRLSLQLQRSDPKVVAAMRSRVVSALHPFMAADDTIRVPVRAALLRA